MKKGEKIALDRQTAYRAYFRQNKGSLACWARLYWPKSLWPEIHRTEGKYCLSLPPAPFSPYFFWRAQCIALPEQPLVASRALRVCFNLMKKVSHRAAPSITSSWKLYIVYIPREKHRINNSLVHLLKYLFSKFFLPPLFLRYGSEWWKGLSYIKGFCK